MNFVSDSVVDQAKKALENMGKNFFHPPFCKNVKWKVTNGRFYRKTWILEIAVGRFWICRRYLLPLPLP